MSDQSHPIEGQVVLLAGARASVPLQRLSPLLDRVQRHLADQQQAYERQYERVDADGTVYYLAGSDHWPAVGDALDLAENEVDAVRRAHEKQFLRDGRRLDREAEFEAALDIRQPVVLA
jgi:hypothetical protein